MIKWADEIETGEIISYDNSEVLVKRVRRENNYVYYIGENIEGNAVEGNLFYARGVEIKKNWSKK